MNEEEMKSEIEIYLSHVIQPDFLLPKAIKMMYEKYKEYKQKNQNLEKIYDEYQNHIVELNNKIFDLAEKNNQLRIEITKNDYVDTDELALNYRLYKDLAYEYQGNCVKKQDLKEILYPTPENPIDLEIQNSKMYKDLCKLIGE